MSSSQPPAGDFLTRKTDSELLFFVKNPGYYHADLVASARRELLRRGVPLTSPAPAPATASAPAQPLEYVEEKNNLPAWILPGVLGLILVGLLTYWVMSQPKAPPVAKSTKPAPPLELRSVETHMLPTFDSLTAADLVRERQAVSARERTDTTATRKYLILARRFWEAENPSAFLIKKATLAPVDSTFPAQAEMTYDKWRRLTSALVYDHKLKPVMQERMDLMQNIARRRLSLLVRMRGNFNQGVPVLTQDVKEDLVELDPLLARLRATSRSGQAGIRVNL
ncbi:hypothetical protein LJY25_11930 [Hymenobacter sp. BT175]|uniref:hypothetical protein n=1 Tax=Hymenobacter translucens TaxID=2886507 RepID=UPI001D0EAEDE|nr:hypothetical protein [Hymenobacter translucens]MCC2547158.1 hypothetical protein [Hymenobacter translucens]